MDSEREPVKRIVVLGSGFGGVEVVKGLQKAFKRQDNVEIILVSKENYVLFTPMLAEVMSGMLDMRHIVTPVRAFCYKAKFYQAEVQSVDFENKQVSIITPVGSSDFEPDGAVTYDRRKIDYDYLVITLGSETNFFGMKDVERYSFTMRHISDAFALRNHLINMLEQANLAQANRELVKKLLTFVVVGGGFNGIETVAELNDFVRDAIRIYYKDIYMTDLRVIVVSSEDKILKEIGEELGDYALEKLRQRGVEFIFNTHAKGATANSVILDDGREIPCYTLVWSTGVTPSKVTAELQCEHDKHHRIIANSYLEVEGCDGVYVVGDCASITDPHTGEPYPTTAQHAIREARVAAKNLVCEVKSKGKKEKFEYKTKGMMAEIGKRTGIAVLFGRKIHGFVAWWLWRTFYLSNLPKARKKIKVVSDWTADLIFKPDVAMIAGLVERKVLEEKESEIKSDRKVAEAG